MSNMTEQEYINAKALGIITAVINILEDLVPENLKDTIKAGETKKVLGTLCDWQEKLFKQVEIKLSNDALDFAKWMDIVCIRNGRFNWKYNADNYTKEYTTKEMFNEWQSLTFEKDGKQIII